MPVRKTRSPRIVNKKNAALRDPLLDRAITLIEGGEVTKSYIANKSGLSTSTINNWLNGKTNRPQSVSLQFALAPLGYELTIQPKGGAKQGKARGK